MVRNGCFEDWRIDSSKSDKDVRLYDKKGSPKMTKRRANDEGHISDVMTASRQRMTKQSRSLKSSKLGLNLKL